jgi:hypothetical protein
VRRNGSGAEISCFVDSTRDEIIDQGEKETEGATEQYKIMDYREEPWIFISGVASNLKSSKLKVGLRNRHARGVRLQLYSLLHV